MLLTFALVTFGLILIRAESVAQAVDYFAGIFSSSLFAMPTIPGYNGEIRLLFIAILVVIEWWGRKNEYPIEKLDFAKKKYIRWAIYLAITFLILCFGTEEQKFIYFQF